MRISDLEGTSPVPPSAYGVLVDVAGLSPPVGLTEVGIVASGDESGELTTDVLDTLIAYRINGVRVLLELPAEVFLTPDAMVRLAANIDADLSLLPPESDDAAEWRRYTDRLVQYTTAWLGQANLVTMVYPISSFFQYLCGAALGFIPSQMATDPYITRRFVEGIRADRINAIKAELEPIILKRFDGMEGLRTFVTSVGAGAIDKLHDMAASHSRAAG